MSQNTFPLLRLFTLTHKWLEKFFVHMDHTSKLVILFYNVIRGPNLISEIETEIHDNQRSIDVFRVRRLRLY